jgi:hypothetical protein
MRTNFERALARSRVPDTRCAMCGMPADARPFDESAVVRIDKPLLALGDEIELARFALPTQYCGVLLYFAQFTDPNARDPSQVLTPDLLWTLSANRQPLYPYVGLDRIVNPWGTGCFPVPIRLEQQVEVTLTVRRVEPRPDAVPEDPPPQQVKVVGGRIVGRFWFDETHGDRASDCR